MTDEGVNPTFQMQDSFVECHAERSEASRIVAQMNHPRFDNQFTVVAFDSHVMAKL